MARIYNTDTVYVMANTIFNEFEIGQSCAIRGFVQMGIEDLELKGKIVCDELRRLDAAQNVIITGSKKNMRKRKFYADSIGGYIAHKIFRFKLTDTDKYTIWRVQ